MTIVRSHQMRDLRWQVHGNPRAAAMAAGTLTASAEGKAFTWIRVQPGPTHLLVEFELAAGSEAMLFVDQLDVRENSVVDFAPRLLEADPGGRAAAVIPLDPRAVRLWLAISSAPPAQNVELRSLRIDLLSGGDEPLSAVGVIFHHPKEISALVAELIRHHGHYRETARRFAKLWGEYHNAARLIQALEEKPREEKQ
jgi:hypothetical protein